MSRAKRFEEAQANVALAKEEAENLRDELNEWKDNMPENLQGGQKYSDLEEAVSQLDEYIDNLETAEGAEVEFPGMY